MYASKKIKRYNFISRIEKKMSLMGEENIKDKDDLPDFIKVPSIKHPDANCLAVKLAKKFKSVRIEYFLMNEV
jgi:hypothetical protein